jgi:NAD(P)-dependent dehydrogenase (short-subunit alcohol dehydrogenase family)
MQQTFASEEFSTSVDALRASALSSQEGMDMQFVSKVAIVTGSGGGIGEGYAKRLATEGASVVVADINTDGAERVAKEIASDGGNAIATYVDIADEASVAAMATIAVDSFGGIDFLVNNAAIYGGMRSDTLLEVEWSYYQRFINVNLNGALLCTRACYRHIAERGGGAIVNQSSTAAYMAVGYYSVAKAGLNSLTVNLAAELAPLNIRVNAIAPGPTDTEATREMVPEEYQAGLLAQMMIKRLLTPDDLTGPLVFLLSDAAGSITGKTLAVDGGQVVQT